MLQWILLILDVPIVLAQGTPTAIPTPSTDNTEAGFLPWIIGIISGAIFIGAALAELLGYSLRDVFGARKKGKEPELDGEVVEVANDKPHHNLPAASTRLIGREEEVKAVAEMLRQEDVRLVTLTGPSGTGKTRVSLQVAWQLLEEFSDGVFFTDLSHIKDPNGVAGEIGRSLKLRQTKQSLSQNLKEYLAGKHILLVLDTFEHLLEAAILISELLSVSEHLKLLVTSQCKLRIHGEREYPIEPLHAPKVPPPLPLESLTQYKAVSLFIERAMAAKPGFTVNNDNAAAVAEICCRLDGLPLAIILVAARVRTSSSPQEILERLQGLDIGVGDRDAPDRHKTLRGAIEWSCNLLNREEKKLFGSVAVFVDGFTLEAAEAICGGGDIMAHNIQHNIESLTDKSLLICEESLYGRSRYRLLNTILEYAIEQFNKDWQAQQIHNRHAEYFLKLAVLTEPKLVGKEQVKWLDVLEAEHANLLSAVQWWLEQRTSPGIENALNMANALGEFWHTRGYLSQGRKCLELVLEASNMAHNASPAQKSSALKLLEAKALHRIGSLALAQGDYKGASVSLNKGLAMCQEVGDKEGEALCLNDLGNIARHTTDDYDNVRSLYNRSLQLWQELDDKRGVALLLNNLGDLALKEGKYDEAGKLYEESLAIRRDLDDEEDIAASLNNLGLVACAKGNYDQALQRHKESLDIREKLGSKLGVAYTLSDLGTVKCYQGDYEPARQYLRDSLELWRDFGDMRNIAACLERMGRVDAETGKHERATCLLAAAETLRYTSGNRLSKTEQDSFDEAVSAARGRLSDAQWERARTAGHQMNVQQAISYALEEK